MKKLFIFSLLSLLSSGLLFSQVSITTNGSLPDGSAMLDVNSNERGILVPRMTGAERDAIGLPATGLLVFCMDDNSFYLNRGTPETPEWKPLISQGEAILKLTPSISTVNCNEEMQGSIYYDSLYNKLCYCDGEYWKMLDGGGYCQCVDLDDDGYDDCDPGHPYDTDGLAADCDDDDPDIFPDNIEYCDGKDNDCDTETPDGSGDPSYGLACDGADYDLCNEGFIICVSGVLICNDFTSDTQDICDFLDNDCNPETGDGTGDPMFGAPCDGNDSDLCEEGYYVCVAGSLICTDNTGDNIEICDDGIDNDCDGYTDSEDPDCQ